MYTAKTFDFSNIKNGLSQTSLSEHYKLYQGYVNNTNHCLTLLKNSNQDPYALSEIRRRFSFEFNGMKNHEYYFDCLQSGPKKLSDTSKLKNAIKETWGSFDIWLAEFKTIAKTRGVGWAILYYDVDAKRLLNVWIDEQHIGHLNSCQYIIGIDMWEHSFVFDYQPSGKGKYIDDYFDNIDWSKAEDIFEKIN